MLIQPEKQLILMLVCDHFSFLFFFVCPVNIYCFVLVLGFHDPAHNWDKSLDAGPRKMLLLGLAADVPCAKALWSCLTFCDPMGCSHPGSSVHRILRQEYWNTGIGFSPLKGSSQSRDRTHVSYISCIGRWVLHH